MIIADALATITQAIGDVIAAWTLLVAGAAVYLLRTCRVYSWGLDTEQPALPSRRGDDTELIPAVPTTQPIPLREAH